MTTPSDKPGKVVQRIEPLVLKTFLSMEFDSTPEIGDFVFAPNHRGYNPNPHTNQYYRVVNINPRYGVMSCDYEQYRYAPRGRVLIPAYHCVRFADEQFKPWEKNHKAEYLFFRHEIVPAQEWLDSQVAELEKRRQELMERSEKILEAQKQLKQKGSVQS